MSNEKNSIMYQKPAGNGPHTPEDHAIKGELTFEDKVVQKIIGLALEKCRWSINSRWRLFFSNIAEKN